MERMRENSQAAPINFQKRIKTWSINLQQLSCDLDNPCDTLGRLNDPGLENVTVIVTWSLTLGST